MRAGWRHLRKIDVGRYAAFRKLLRAVRLQAGMSQVELARRLGRPQSFVSKAETGERRLDCIELADVLDAVGVTFVEFMRRLRTLWP